MGCLLVRATMESTSILADKTCSKLKIYPFSFENFYTLFEIKYGVWIGIVILTIVPYLLEKAENYFLKIVYITVFKCKFYLKIVTNLAETSVMPTFVIGYRRSGVQVKGK